MESALQIHKMHASFVVISIIVVSKNNFLLLLKEFLLMNIKPNLKQQTYEVKYSNWNAESHLHGLPSYDNEADTAELQIHQKRTLSVSGRIKWIYQPRESVLH